MDTYYPEELSKHLEQLINNACHEIVPTARVTYNIKLVAITDSHFIFTFMYSSKKYDDIPRMIKICRKKNDIIHKSRKSLVNKLSGVIKGTYEGINGTYKIKFDENEKLIALYATQQQIESTPVPLSIAIPYVKINGILYTLILPKELQLLIANKVDNNTALNYLNTACTKILTDGDFRVSLMSLSKQLHDDLIMMANDFKITKVWKDLYMCVKTKLDISLLYNIGSGPEFPIKSDFLIINGRTTPGSLIFAVRLKFLFPELYVKLLSFHLAWKATAEDWISTMIALYNLCDVSPDSRYIKALSDGWTKYPKFVREFPNEADCKYLQKLPIESSVHSRLQIICKSPMLLWYILNVPKVSWTRDEIFSIHHYDILSSLYELQFRDWLGKITDPHLQFLLECIVNDMRDSQKDYIKAVYPDVYFTIRGILQEEKQKRGI